MVDGSIVARLWRDVTRSFPAITPAAGDSAVLRIASRFPPRQADAVVPVLNDSRLCKVVERVLVTWITAWPTSFLRRAISQVDPISPEQKTQRVRLGGAMLLSATVTHVAMAGIDRLAETPGSGLGWIGVAVAAVVCLLRPDAVAAAWTSFRCLRLK